MPKSQTSRCRNFERMRLQGLSLSRRLNLVLFCVTTANAYLTFTNKWPIPGAHKIALPHVTNVHYQCIRITWPSKIGAHTNPSTWSLIVDEIGMGYIRLLSAIHGYGPFAYFLTGFNISKKKIKNKSVNFSVYPPSVRFAQRHQSPSFFRR